MLLNEAEEVPGLSGLGRDVEDRGQGELGYLSSARSWAGARGERDVEVGARGRYGVAVQAVAESLFEWAWTQAQMQALAGSSSRVAREWVLV